MQYLQPGQKISGVAQQGYAEYALLPASQVFPVPDQLPAGQALIFQALTACHLLDQSAGYHSLLVTAAAGGIGSMVIQIARSRGLQKIIGLTGNAKKWNMYDPWGLRIPSVTRMINGLYICSNSLPAMAWT